MPSLPDTMKAAILMGRNHLEIKEVARPNPGPMEVLLKVESCACCGTDVALMNKPFAGQPPYGDFIPGHEYSGVVAALGEGVDEFSVGDRVAVEAHLGCMRCKNCRLGHYTACLNYGTEKHRANGMTANGGFAQYVVNNINTVHRIPDPVEFNEAALVTNLGCVLYGFETIGGFVAGQTVAILGPGPIGLIATQVAKTLGAEKVFLTGTRASRLNMGAERGADRLINIYEENPIEAVLADTGGIGVDLAVDAAGVKTTPMDAIKITKPMGKILMLGIPHEPVTVDLEDLLMKNKAIYTVRGEGRSNVARAISLLGTGKMSLKPYLTHTFPLEQIDKAFETFIKRIDGAIKVVVKSNE